MILSIDYDFDIDTENDIKILTHLQRVQVIRNNTLCYKFFTVLLLARTTLVLLVENPVTFLS